MKEDECGKTENKRKRVDEEDGIFARGGLARGQDGKQRRACTPRAQGRLGVPPHAAGSG
jgi:hypothetical protein